LRRRALIALLAAVGVVSVACGPEPGPLGVGVLNDTGQTIVVSYVIDGRETAITEGDGGRVEDSTSETFRLDLFDPGNTQNCTTGDLVIRSLEGQELDRFPPPECDGRVLRALDPGTSVN
jgi:hypothetical protein